MSTCDDCGYFIPLSCMKGQCGFQDEPHETQESICAWANETFGAPGSNAGTAARANKEMSELLMALVMDDSYEGAPEEAADVIIVLMRIFERFGTTWQQEVNKKMKVNRGRKWHLDGAGHGYHVKDFDDALLIAKKRADEELQKLRHCDGPSFLERHFPLLAKAQSDAAGRFDGPVEEHLDSLKWDGVERVKTSLAEVVDAASKRFEERPLYRASIEAREEMRKSRETERHEMEASPVFRVRWSEEDREWVGTCSRYPSLSFLDQRYLDALYGIRKMVHDVERDLARESFSEHLDKEP